MKKSKFAKRIICMILALAACLGIFTATATGASAATVYNESVRDSIVAGWNANSKSASNKCTSAYAYSGAYQCAAFSRYVFMQLFGHTDTLNNKSNQVTIKKFTTVSDMMAFLKANAVPGDAIRMTNLTSGSTHILNLFDIDASGKFHICESNYIYKGTNNKARAHTYSSLLEMINHGTGAKVKKTNTNQFNCTVEIKLIHSVKNTGTVLSCNRKLCSSHNYSGGICTKCGHEWKYTVTSMKATSYKVTKTSSAPVWNRPYSNYSTQTTRMLKGTVVTVVGKTVNNAGNTWYLLSTGDWIYSGNVIKTSTPSGTRYVFNTDGTLNMRASANGKIIGSIPEGAAVIVNTSKVSGKWIWVTYNGVSGYVCKTYLSTSAPKLV